MGLRFDAMLHSILGNESSGAGRIKCSRGPQAFHPWPKAQRGKEIALFSITCLLQTNERTLRKRRGKRNSVISN